MSKRGQVETKFAPEEYDIVADYKFTEDEKRRIATDLAQKNIAAESLEKEKKAITSKFTADINQKKADINLLSQYLSTGMMRKSYRCTLGIDRIKRLRLWKDKETQQIVKTEPMRPEDAQIKLGEVE
jgi:hypothetical protein